MSSWYDVYKERMNNRYRMYIKNRYQVFLSILHGICLEGGPVAEMGCGAANITMALLDLMGVGDNYHTLVDSDPMMLQLAQRNMRGYEHVHHLLCADMYKVQLPQTQLLIHAHGVLEHLSDVEIRMLIELQLSQAKNVVHYVPSHLYEVPSFGDERLMPSYRWKAICSPDEIVEFNKGYDYALIWRR